jgi:hypothetical protein
VGTRTAGQRRHSAPVSRPDYPDYNALEKDRRDPGFVLRLELGDLGPQATPASVDAPCEDSCAAARP